MVVLGQKQGKKKGDKDKKENETNRIEDAKEEVKAPASKKSWKMEFFPKTDFFYIFFSFYKIKEAAQSSPLRSQIRRPSKYPKMRLIWSSRWIV